MEVIQTTFDEMSELRCMVNEPRPPSYSTDDHKLANLHYILALDDESVDPHDTIIWIDVKLHDIYSQDDAYDPGKPDLGSEVRRNLTVASLHELIKSMHTSVRKSKSGMILEIEGTIESNHIAAIGSKLTRLLHSYRNWLWDRMCKVEASTPSLMSYGVPSK